LTRFRAISVPVGVALAVLVFVGVPLQLAGGNASVVHVVGPIHGILYILYLLAGLEVFLKGKLRLGHLVAIAAAGLVPLLVVLVARRVSGWVEKRP
jgi:integral membrane protein